jgi:hypothetical protein
VLRCRATGSWAQETASRWQSSARSGQPGESKEHKVRKLITAMAIGGALAAGGIVVAGPASADGPCGGAVVFGNGGGRCDYDQRPDGSFTRCDTVYVLGFGGTNCYLVSPPPPADTPPAA